MAKCTKCGGEMGKLERVCPHCGYDWLWTPKDEEPKGLVYSTLADVALLIGQVVAALACVMGLIGCVVSLLSGKWLDALIRGPIAVLLLFAMFVVFGRALDRNNHR